MTVDPAYLANLKAYARDQYGTDGDEDAGGAQLTNESDRAVAMLAATGIEDALEFVLIRKMPNLADDPAATKSIFSDNGSVGTFSSKILMAYALGLIVKDTRKQIDIFRHIRNACAHSRKPISFSTPVLREACKYAIGELWDNLIDHESTTLRTAFISASARLGLIVVTGRTMTFQEAHEASLAFAKRSTSPGT